LSSKRSVVLAGLALAVTSLAAAAPAAASAATLRPAHEVTARPGVSPGGPMIPAGARGDRVLSQNWSGYAATGHNFKTVSASWVQPRVSCKSGGGAQLAGFWVGIDGWGDQTVEQTGDADVCSGASASYYAWSEMYPNAPHNYSSPLKPGDHISASVTYTGGGKFTLKISDATRHWSHTAHGSLGSAKRASAEVIIETPCCTSGGNLYPLAHFAKVTFTKATVDGSGIGTHHPIRITMADLSGRHLDAISALTGNNKFSATWKRKS
jgi:peptidase A4-like protein